MPDPPLHLGHGCGGVALIPAPIQILSCLPKLYDKVRREILRFSFPTLFMPKTYEGTFIMPHDNPSVPATNTAAAVLELSPLACHDYLRDRSALYFTYHMISNMST